MSIYKERKTDIHRLTILVSILHVTIEAKQIQSGMNFEKHPVIFSFDFSV